MKIVLVLFLLSTAIGCAQVGVVAFENHPEGQIFKVCGNRYAKSDDFEKTASNQCSGGFKTLSGGVESVGSYTSSSYSSYGGNGTMSSVRVPIGMACMVYQCESSTTSTKFWPSQSFSDCYKICSKTAEKIGTTPEKCIADMGCK